MTSYKGINLGGWLIAERWMTPDLFEGVKGDGEAALVIELGRDEAERRLRAHRDTFITERDIKWLADHRINLVRIPFGYWLFERTQNFFDGESHLVDVLKWCQKHNVKVVLDLHGLQGSQNGYDHSGRAGRIGFYWPWNRRAALRTLAYVCKTYGLHPQVVGIEVINEPKVNMLTQPLLLRYYARAIALVSRSTPQNVTVIVHDAFRPVAMARALQKRGLITERVVLDAHLYQVFRIRDNVMTLRQHITEVDAWNELLEQLNGTVSVMIGEWSAALRHTTYAIEGKDEAAGAPRYFKAQQRVFAEQSWAHCYWSYKAPGAGTWDYRSRADFHS
ncbi:MAG TPA: cellulase family glycosylhydrolase [Candidatus Saccharimonadales bacterium]|jgi:glucan 1,3-beta-glucosidase